ncbi:MAG: hypothetical protein EP343_03390 [Deltaproteobacteria bacterium]|nr:MAG: hypothetical protein EP343_03390 [Deltaproteobacteria bacterium]
MWSAVSLRLLSRRFLIVLTFLLVAGSLTPGCQCTPIDNGLPPGQVRLSLSLRTPAFQRFSRLRDVTLTINVPDQDPVVKTFDRVLLRRPLITELVVPGNQEISVQVSGKSWDGKSNWGGQ